MLYNKIYILHLIFLIGFMTVYGRNRIQIRNLIRIRTIWSVPDPTKWFRSERIRIRNTDLQRHLPIFWSSIWMLYLWALLASREASVAISLTAIWEMLYVVSNWLRKWAVLFLKEKDTILLIRVGKFVQLWPAQVHMSDPGSGSPLR